MKEIRVLGIDLAKNVFQLHGVGVDGVAVVKKRLNRDRLLAFVSNLQPCVIGIEACGGSNYWSREFRSLGHTVKQIAPQFVVPFRKSDKNDRNDAEAICEAIQRPSMRFVPTKETRHQDVQNLHRVRSRLMGNRTALGNEIRGLLLEYGIAIAQKFSELKKALNRIASDEQSVISSSVREVILRLQNELRAVEEEIKFYDDKIKEVFLREPVCQRLSKIEGIGRLTATAIYCGTPDPGAYKNGRQYSASLGLVPKQNSSGNRERLLSITKRGDIYLRTLLIHGARAFLKVASRRNDKKSLWAIEKSKTRGFNRAAVAIASKNARTIWAMLKNNTAYQVAE